MSKTNILCGQRIRLTAVAKEDAASLAQWQGDAGYLRLYAADPAYPQSPEQFEEWIQKVAKAKDTFLFAIRPVDSDELIGTVTLDGISWTNRNTWLAIGIGNPRSRRQGFGTEATQLILKYAFHELNLHRVQLTVFSYNKAAIALYEKAGFTREGGHREYLKRDGQWYDMYLYGILSHEWEAAQG